MPPKVEVVHATSPLCNWSWGYEPVINRLEAIYGKQVKFTVVQAIPHTDRQKWLEDYDMTEKEALAFQKEIDEAHGFPIKPLTRWEDFPETALPAGLAVKATSIVAGARAERHLSRALMFAGLVEGRDTSRDDVISDVVRKQSLDLAAILKAVEGEDAMKALEEDMHRGGHGANFYSILVRDGDKTTVALEQAYDPARVERAIDYVAGRKLKKTPPKDVVGYVLEHGPVPLLEVQRMFALAAPQAKKALAAGEKKGKIERLDIPGLVNGTRFWRAASR